MLNILKWLLRAIAAVVLVAAATLVVAAALYSARPPERTAAGQQRITSLYLTMSDGVRIAIDVVLPKTLAANVKIPALIKGTPYWRAPQLTFLGGALVQLGLVDSSGIEPDAPLLTARGYAVVVVDTRGTGASFGHTDIFLGDREVADFGEVIDWVTKQSWSNGRVGAYGFSYRGLLATGAASLGHPALKAIAPSFDYPDLYLTTYPGGVLSQRFVKSWSTLTAAINRGDPPCPSICRLFIAGPKRVDVDKDGALLASAIADHAHNWNVYDCVRKMTARDDKVCSSGKTLDDVSEFADRAAIEKSNIPIYTTAGYFDANSPAQALARFQSFANPQDMTIGALSHGGYMNTDPFAAKNAGADPPYARQVSDMADFFDRYLKRDDQPIDKTLRYFVLNGGGWKTAASWPPLGVASTPWYLADNHTLAATAPADVGVDKRDTDFTATTGLRSRYESPVELSQPGYNDRAAQDAKLLVYTSEPFKAAVQIVGTPVAKLTIATSTSDAEVIVYLEHIASNGSVTYLTEGVLRLAHRKLATEVSVASGDPHHTYLKADAAPMIPDKPEPIVIELSPIAVAMHKGDRIRVAIAGADADNLERIPATGSAAISVTRGGSAASYVEIPQMTAPN